MIAGRLVDNAYEDRWSQLTFLLFLSEGYEGGTTRSYLDSALRGGAGSNLELAQTVDVSTPLGAALCFPHGTQPLHRRHASPEIGVGIKYIIRSDVLFEL